ncbi:hypothetical protein LTR35_015773 [Friedmanniomyces endolithicus]|uniref:Uncharacterized protein n=1 Tax=Friedmanniomyces endolithicus TaxID=329885 RepID=A0AAN6FBF7_9PEZI|nr:hypothetical protein LTR35_015773 [Friedmanniomyces endolithicus]KAK0275819.1 hypothetical protein LTS00_014852 [Friedmanniomyces endolithicus]KAK0307828.1 hypothetical protein LTR82_015764 [Friedmanniomyces endolithicus]KAK0979561.1 hypothetical protein LTR54_015574 [Friedmanniomyces endolithicus]
MPTDADGNRDCSNMKGLSHASNVHGVHKDDDPPAYSESDSEGGRAGGGDGKGYLMREQGGK